MSARTCRIEGCDRKHRSRGVCGMHYHRLRTAGELKPYEWPRPFWDRVSDHVDIGHPAGCWQWTGSHTDLGYGTICLERGVMRMAHREIYQRLVGTVSADLHLDHLCRNPSCVNPDHLEPVTPAENKLRGESAFAKNARKKSCVHGHPFTEANTYITLDGKRRRCRTCDHNRAVSRGARTRAERTGEVVPGVVVEPATRSFTVEC